MEDMSWFTYAQIFDDSLIISQKETNCFVLKTSDGLIITDAIWPSKQAFDAIINSIQSVDWNPTNIKKVAITHGHVDHTGCGKYFVERFNANTYLSKIDDIFWQERPTKPTRPETWKDYNISDYIQDGDIITLGDKIIYIYGSPGHTPGCLSYIFPVTDNGEIHMAGLWGGTIPPRNRRFILQYLQSLDYFIEQASDKEVDVALSNHTAIDNGLEHINYSKARMSYMPNIYYRTGRF